jgi:transposase
MCLLRSGDGEAAAVIARVTGLSPDAVSDIRRRWRERGLRSLRDRPRPGRPSRVTRRYRRELRRALRVGPLACGYVFTVWSIARLAAHLRRRTRIGLSADWLRRLVHAEGFVIGRPKHTLRGKRDRRAYREARRRLAQLKKGRSRPTRTTNCRTATPPPSSCCRTWCAAGTAADASRR